jgi:nitrite reductase/ring-hydroxylating ferredoxin subunit
MSSQRVCALAELEDRDVRGYHLVSPGGKALSLIVVRKGEAVHVYLNRCPHTGVNLEWQPDQFFDADGAFLQCATHGALFRPEDGYCVRGPCAGDSLEILAARVKDGQVYVSP